MKFVKHITMRYARKIVIHNVNHYFHIQKPDETAKAIFETIEFDKSIKLPQTLCVNGLNAEEYFQISRQRLPNAEITSYNAIAPESADDSGAFQIIPRVLFGACFFSRNRRAYPPFHASEYVNDRSHFELHSRSKGKSRLHFHEEMLFSTPFLPYI